MWYSPILTSPWPFTEFRIFFMHRRTNFLRTSSSSFSASSSSSSSWATSSSSSASSSLTSLHHHHRRHRQRHRQHYPQHHHHCQHQCRRHHCQHNRQHHGQHHRHYHHSHNIISIIIHATGVSRLRLASSQAAQLVKAHCSYISLKKARPHVKPNLLSKWSFPSDHLFLHSAYYWTYYQSQVLPYLFLHWIKACN